MLFLHLRLPARFDLVHIEHKMIWRKTCKNGSLTSDRWPRQGNKSSQYPDVPWSGSHRTADVVRILRYFIVEVMGDAPRLAYRITYVSPVCDLRHSPGRPSFDIRHSFIPGHKLIETAAVAAWIIAVIILIDGSATPGHPNQCTT